MAVSQKIETMTAVRFHAYGKPDVLVEESAPRPEPGVGEVLIRVYAAGVNPVDWKVRSGAARRFVTRTLPMIPGWDVAGIIEAVGPRVASFKEGDAVFAMLDLSREGGYAEYAVVSATGVARKPSTLGFAHAAAVPLAATTAWQALFDEAKLTRGRKVLIHAAAGGVGHFAVQFARWKGAQIIGTASTRSLDFVRELGADDVIDYTKSRFEENVRDMDVVIDLVGGDTQERSWSVLKRAGVLVSTLSLTDEKLPTRYGVRGRSFFARPNGSQLATIAELIHAGYVKPHVESILPLSEARRAHEMSESGHVRGKIVLKVRD